MFHTGNWNTSLPTHTRIVQQGYNVMPFDDPFNTCLHSYINTGLTMYTCIRTHSCVNNAHTHKHEIILISGIMFVC